ncbi:conjugal transfer protein TrbL, partial [Rhodoplanes serenus]
GAALAGGASTAYSLGAAGQTGAAGVASGLSGVARAAGGAATSPLRRAASRTADSMRSSFSEGAKAALEATGGTSTKGSIGGGPAEAAPPPAADGPPAWARRMKRSQALSHGVTAAAHAVRSGDSHGGGSSINLSESDR